MQGMSPEQVRRHENEINELKKMLVDAEGALKMKQVALDQVSIQFVPRLYA